jgi:hypothetical protein
MVLHPEPVRSVPNIFLPISLAIVTVFDYNPVADLAVFVFLDEQVLQSKAFKSAQCTRHYIRLYHSLTYRCTKRTPSQ